MSSSSDRRPEATAATETRQGESAAPRLVIEGYELLRELSRGGQGVVYLAVQRSTKRKVAVKVLDERGFGSRSAQRRFEREAEFVASLKHPNIVSVYDSGTTADGRPFCSMEYTRGCRLDQFVRDGKLARRSS